MDEQARDTAGITTRLTLAYVRSQGGDDAVAEVVRRADVPHTIDELEDERTWSTYATKVALFEAAAEVLDDREVGLHVGSSLLGHQIGGALRLVIGALGSPGQVLRSIAKANAKFSSASSMRCEDVTAGRGTVVRRLLPPRVPHRLDCDYTRGLLSQVSVLFGLPPADVEHPQCQVTGADECVYVISWRRRRFRRRRVNPTETFELAALREQLIDLQRTVADLVSTDDLDEILRRIATRASAAVRAQRYLLAVQFPDEPEPRVIGDGYAEPLAQELGRRLLADEDDVLNDRRRLTAEVAAGGVRYGRLAAETSTGEGFLPSEQALLDAYAGMAATALTRARALVEARLRGERAEALLDLAHGLALETTEVGAAERVVAAVPTVVNADRAALMLWDESEACLRAVAVHGMPTPAREALLDLTISARHTPLVTEARQFFRPRVLTADSDDPWIRSTLAAFDLRVVVAAPIVVHGAYHGAIFAGWSDAGRHGSGIAAQRVLGSLADQAGTALAGVRLLTEARHAASHDALTGLPNRVLFGQHLEQAIVADRRERLGTALCFVDLDGFKAVNDHHGHATGDELLVAVAARLRGQVRESDVVARISGDEFGVLLHRLEHPDDATAVGATLVRCLGEPFALGVGEVRIGGSIGIAFAAAAADAEELLRTADDAMYAAKTERGTYRVADLGADRFAFDGSRTAVTARREPSN
ncbi:MAG: diguanylate cyclase [Egicoccus sp.]